MDPTVVSFINYKGGVAKTTSTYHVGCWLAYRKRKRVLLIDIDPVRWSWFVGQSEGGVKVYSD